MRQTRLKRFVAFVFFVLLLFVNHSMCFAEPVYTVRADNNYPPYEYLDNRVPNGFNIDLIKAVAEVMNLKIQINMGPWDEVRTDLETGKINVLAGMYYSEERDKKVDFSAPHVIVSQAIFTRKNSEINALEDLKGLEVIVQKNDVMNDFVVENNITDTDKIIAVENQEQAIALLASGKHDAAVLSKLQAFYFMKKNNINNVQPVGEAMMLQEYCFAVKEGDDKLLTQLNEGLNIIKSNGTYKKIYNKWFGVYEEQNVSEQVKKILMQIIAPILILVFAISLWTWSLKREVNRKTKELKESNDEIRILNEDLENRIALRTEEIKAINQELKDFAYIVSHDLKAPLRGISQTAKWLSEAPTITFTEETQELMDLLLSRVYRMDNLINGILAYSKASRTASLNKQVNVKVVLERIMNSLEIPSTINIKIQEDMPTVFGNEVQIEEIFQNLIINGFQHVSEIDGFVEVGCEERADDWRFWVRDNGPGIEEKYFEKIFGMFQTLESKDKKESTGIGLAIVKKSVEIHHGIVWVESEFGKGATFNFTIPKRSENP